MTSPFITARRRRLVVLAVTAGLCLFAWWAMQPVSSGCPIADPTEVQATISSEAFGSSSDAPCAAETQHPRLYGWLGLGL
ncbi:hypothetical protein [Streptomyces indicus]|uniref:Uncharacterized protein n=1 Tax=Streptomyces indicus TaxID=417292 RepID=A0A1G9JP73_9ACTN|nr:hypothetical protein [Streptomyces indicus]SDL39112.1 hypothetical protein SAMN05421806_13325 [Streptomyces indicus]